MKLTIDLNADLGEGAASERELLQLISSANIAGLFHTGDPEKMARSIAAARDAGVAVGAHPSLFDRENFGRREWAITPEEVFHLMIYQLGAFQAVARSVGVRPHHVKPHGALYNLAARQPELAEALVRAIIAVDRQLLLFAPGGSALAEAAAALEVPLAQEVFADRNYLPDGALVPRSRPDALLHDAGVAAARVLRILREGKVQAVDGSELAITAETICVHGDTPEAVAFAHQLREHFAAEGIAVAAPELR